MHFYLFQQCFSLFAFVQPEDPSLWSEVAPKDVVNSDFPECHLLWSELSGRVQPWGQKNAFSKSHWGNIRGWTSEVVCVQTKSYLSLLSHDAWSFFLELLLLVSKPSASSRSSVWSSSNKRGFRFLPESTAEKWQTPKMTNDKKKGGVLLCLLHWKKLFPIENC